MTKTELLVAYRAALLAMQPWAQDAVKLERFMASAERTIRTVANTWDHRSPSMATAWKSLGGKGKPSLTAMRALPD